jgi:hypothetical protein
VWLIIKEDHMMKEKKSVLQTVFMQLKL